MLKLNNKHSSYSINGHSSIAKEDHEKLISKKTFNGLRVELEYDLKNIKFQLAKLERLPVHKDLGQLDENIFNFIVTENNKAKYKNTVTHQ